MSPASAYPGNTLTTSSASTGPGSGVLAGISAPEGTYKVTATIILSGTAETAFRNIRLRETAAALVADNLPTISGVGPVVLTWDQVDVHSPAAGGNGALELYVIAAAAAGSVYSAVIQATRIA